MSKMPQAELKSSWIFNVIFIPNFCEKNLPNLELPTRVAKF